VVEFHRLAEAETAAGGESGALPPGVALPGTRGLWQAFPVEYKRGRLRREEGYEVQLCAQALCLEEMLGAAVPLGAVFYGQPRKRLEVLFGGELRRETETAAVRLHELIRDGKTPPARYEKKCESCSLLSLCMPKTTGGRKSVDRYLAGMLEYDDG
jgi:CRISPR-associated exonuclease Cas4